jgi:hypothetical protein
MNGSVCAHFPSHPILIIMLHTTPNPLAGGSLSLQATSTGQLNAILTLYDVANPPVYDHLCFRGFQSRYLAAAPQRDCDTHQERPSLTDQHVGWRRCTTLPAQFQLTVRS